MQDVAWKDLLGVMNDELVTVAIGVLCDAVAVVAGFDRLPVHAPAPRTVRGLARQKMTQQHVRAIEMTSQQTQKK